MITIIGPSEFREKIDECSTDVESIITKLAGFVVPWEHMVKIMPDENYAKGFSNGKGVKVQNNYQQMNDALTILHRMQTKRPVNFQLG